MQNLKNKEGHVSRVVRKKSKYAVLIIGAGKQGCLCDAPGSENSNKIISFAHAFKEHESFDLIGFVDKDPEKALKASTIWDCKLANTGFEYVLTYLKIDIAVVATPDETHYEILKQLAEYPLKLVIVEKPLCETVRQAKEIVELYKAKNIPLMVNYTRRYLPYYENLKQGYQDGKFGEIEKYFIVFNRGFVHSGTHAADFMSWFFDGKFNNNLELNEINGVNYRVWQIDLYFEKYHWQEQRIGEVPVWSYYDDAQWHVVNNAFEFLKGREPLKCSGEDALHSLEICYKIMNKER